MSSVEVVDYNATLALRIVLSFDMVLSMKLRNLMLDVVDTKSGSAVRSGFLFLTPFSQLCWQRQRSPWFLRRTQKLFF